MRTIDEQIAILQAFKEGKDIEMGVYDNGKLKWLPLSEFEISVKNYKFDFNNNKYRIKPNAKLRPYKSAKEFLSALAEHGPFIDISPAQLGDYYDLPIGIGPYGVRITQMVYSLSKIKKFHWQDGTPCGVLEE